MITTSNTMHSASPTAYDARTRAMFVAISVEEDPVNPRIVPEAHVASNSSINPTFVLRQADDSNVVYERQRNNR
ncbi:hypothetical protein RhiXN_11708 [Rhizoctonia solani]|uniref:Uncharacterized protein n=1 Tax=Rhizoctonia solani TaxID=456999 RepID=A0A8H8P347_9AGAM|nr:uncharacterized protein RhiXN_11708 [Rhizoctonia solani]QRW24796.1 hypothetical protein RhiXN_11708 [Rhizoctonia solani]